jgi:hypothetical protein
MRSRSLAVIGLLSLCACAPSRDESDSEKTSSKAQAVETSVTAPFLDPTQITIDVTWTPPTDWQTLTHELDVLSKPFRDISAIISGVTGAINEALVVAKFLGLLGADPDQWAIFRGYLDKQVAGLQWNLTATQVDSELNQIQPALDELRADYFSGVPYTSGTTSFSNADAALDVLEDNNGNPVDGIPAAYLRDFQESVTDGEGSNWKSIIPGVVGVTRPTVYPPNNVYDWRLHIPALLKAIPQRLTILAAADANFRTDHLYDPQLTRDRDSLLHNYEHMYDGIVCGSTATFGTVTPAPPRNSVVYACKVACADMYTGFSGSKTVPAAWSSDGKTIISGCQAIASSPVTSANFKYSVLEIRSQINRAMPFFAMKSVADTLFRVNHPAPDLTEYNQRISLEASQNLCLAVESDVPNDGTPAWLAPCDGTTSQWWSYDRGTGTIWNPGINKCLSAQLSGHDAELTQPASPGEPLSSYAYPVVITTCDSSAPEQRWTFDSQHLVLQNGIGPEAMLSVPTIGAHAELAVRGVIGQPQWSRSTNQWHADSVSVANNHPLLVSSGSSAYSGLAVDAQSIYWGSGGPAGGIEKTTLGQSLSTAELIGGQAWTRTIALDSDNVYWNDSTAPGTVMKLPKGGYYKGTPSTPVSAPLPIINDSDLPEGIAVDASGVYYTTLFDDESGGAIKKTDVNGGNAATLAVGSFNPYFLALDDTSVYFTDYNSAANVMKTSKAPGGPVTVLASGQSFPYDIKVDATSVYWVNFSGGQVMKVGKNGGTPVALASQQSQPINLAVDSSGVFWDNFGAGTVMTVGLNGGTPTVLAEGATSPHLMTTDASYAYFETYDSPPRIEKVAKLHSNEGAPVAPQVCALLGGTLLASGQGLVASTSQASIKTCDNQFTLTMQTDGNLVLYKGPTAVWASNTVGSFADRAIMQGDGNLVVYNPSGNPVWSSGTVGHAGANLMLNSAGALSIYDGHTTYWLTSPAAPTKCGAMTQGQGLVTGSSLASCNGRYLLTMQSDGNLVLYDDMAGPLWASGTTGSQVYAVLSAGALYVNAPAGNHLWSSNAPPPTPNATLALADSGNLAVSNALSIFGIIQTTVSFSTNTMGAGVGSFASNASTWTNFTSDELPPVSCTGNTAVDGFGCTNSYCDNLSLECTVLKQGTAVNPSIVASTPWFSEEQAGVPQPTSSCITFSDNTPPSCVSPSTNGITTRNGNQGFCAAGIMTGVSCSGSYCDNVKLQCAKLTSGHIDAGFCYWTGWQSEEQGAWIDRGSFTGCSASSCDFFVNGAECSGSYCDNMRFWVCPVIP